MTGDEWFGLLIGFLGVFAIVAGVCAHEIAQLISAVASRVRYGKLPHPDQPSQAFVTAFESVFGEQGEVGGHVTGDRWECVCGASGTAGGEAQAALALYRHRRAEHVDPKPQTTA